MSASYPIVLLDPPWKYYGDPTKWAAAGKHYPLMDADEIAAAPPPLARPGIAFIWTTSQFMSEAIKLLDRWGLTYRGVAFVWVKTSRSGVPFGARGVRPSITKPLTEFVLAGSNVAKGRPLPLADESIRQTVFAPPREHSRKPDEVQDALDAMYPGLAKLEMYARGARSGWDSWGLETDKFSNESSDQEVEADAHVVRRAAALAASAGARDSRGVLIGPWSSSMKRFNKAVHRGLL